MVLESVTPSPPQSSDRRESQFIRESPPRFSWNRNALRSASSVPCNLNHIVSSAQFRINNDNDIVSPPVSPRNDAHLTFTIRNPQLSDGPPPYDEDDNSEWSSSPGSSPTRVQTSRPIYFPRRSTSLSLTGRQGSEEYEPTASLHHGYSSTSFDFGRSRPSRCSDTRLSHYGPYTRRHHTSAPLFSHVLSPRPLTSPTNQIISSPHLAPRALSRGLSLSQSNLLNACAPSPARSHENRVGSYGSPLGISSSYGRSNSCIGDSPIPRSFPGRLSQLPYTRCSHTSAPLLTNTPLQRHPITTGISQSPVRNRCSTVERQISPDTEACAYYSAPASPTRVDENHDSILSTNQTYISRLQNTAPWNVDPPLSPNNTGLVTNSTPPSRCGSVDNLSNSEDLCSNNTSVKTVVPSSSNTNSNVGPNGAVIHFRRARRVSLPHVCVSVQRMNLQRQSSDDGETVRGQIVISLSSRDRNSHGRPLAQPMPEAVPTPAALPHDPNELPDG